MISTILALLLLLARTQPCEKVGVCEPSQYPLLFGGSADETLIVDLDYHLITDRIAVGGATEDPYLRGTNISNKSSFVSPFIVLYQNLTHPQLLWAKNIISLGKDGTQHFTYLSDVKFSSLGDYLILHTDFLTFRDPHILVLSTLDGSVVNSRAF